MTWSGSKFRALPECLRHRAAAVHAPAAPCYTGCNRPIPFRRLPVPARIRHIALSVKDIDATADFYEKAFGLTRSEKSEGPTAYRVYMSDGEINLALLQYKSEVGSGLKSPSDFVGIHHFGFQCDDLEAQQKQIEQAGGKFFFDL